MTDGELNIICERAERTWRSHDESLEAAMKRELKAMLCAQVLCEALRNGDARISNIDSDGERCWSIARSVV